MTPGLNPLTDLKGLCTGFACKETLGAGVDKRAAGGLGTTSDDVQDRIKDEDCGDEYHCSLHEQCPHGVMY